MSTPIRRQYLSIKRQYPDVIVFFRLGDFYETFDEDAKIASKVLDITLTSRSGMGKENRVPMAGIPYHAAEGYIGRLIAAGHKVAVVEQVSSPNGRDLVDRKVTRVVTPGTVTEPSMLDGSSNRYIAAALVEGSRAGLAVADLSTGEFATTEINAADGAAALCRRRTRVLAYRSGGDRRAGERRGPTGAVVAAFSGTGFVSPLHRRCWRLNTATDELMRQFEVEALDAYGCAGKPYAIRAAGALLQYLAETQLGSLGQIVDLVTYSVERHMTLDSQTLRNLELIETSRGDRSHSLLNVLDCTRTSMGARLLRRWLGQPLVDVAEIDSRLDAVALFVDQTLIRARLREALGSVSDVERLINRVVTGASGPRELRSLGTSLQQLPAINQILESDDRPSDLSRLPDCSTAARLIADALMDDPPAVLGAGQSIRSGYSAAAWTRCDARRTRRVNGSLDWSSPNGSAPGSRLSRWATTSLRLLPGGQSCPRRNVPTTIRKQTLVNAERFITPELKEFESKVLNAEERIAELEGQVYRQLLAVNLALSGAMRAWALRTLLSNSFSSGVM